MASCYQTLFRTGIESGKKYWGFKIISPTKDQIAFVKYALQSYNPIFISISRPFNEVAKSYYKQKWAQKYVEDLFKQWNIFYRDDIRQHCQYGIQFSSINELSINTLFDELGIENRNNIKTVLDTKIQFANDDVNEPRPLLDQILENL